MKRVMTAAIAVLLLVMIVAPQRAQSAGTVLMKQFSEKTVIPELVLCPFFSVTPSVGPTAPRLKSGCSLAGATAVHFGSTAAIFVVQADGTLIATPPALPGGSDVTVTVTMPHNRLMTGTSAYSYPIAEMDMNGPHAHSLGRDQAEENWWTSTNSHLLSERQPETLSYTTIAPPLNIAAYFSLEPIPESTQPPYVLGNLGRYTAKLQVCSVTASTLPTLFAPTKQPCTNWDSTPGTWTDVTSATTNVHAPTTATASLGNVALSTAGLFSGGDPENMQLARTLRILYTFNEGDDDAQFSNVLGEQRFDALYGKPFIAIIAPTTLFQMKAVPYTILYQPPGDQSTVTFSATQTYGAIYTLGTSTENSSSYSTGESKSAQFSEELAFVASVGAGFNSSWDQSTKVGFGTTTGTTGSYANTAATGLAWPIPASPTEVPGSGSVCASMTSCATQTQLSNVNDLEPYWLDTFILLVHPQYAYWQLSTQDQHYVMYGAVPVTVDMTVAELDACARGMTWFGLSACQIPYSDTGLTGINGQGVVYSGSAQTLTLTPAECLHLLALDPFYLQGQNAQISPTRGTLIDTPTYGASIGNPARPTSVTYTNTEANSNTGSTMLKYTSSVTTTVSAGPNFSVGGSVSAPVEQGAPSVSGKVGLTMNDLSKWSTEIDVNSTYSNSTAVSSQLVTSASVTLNDVDSSNAACKPGSCHNPLPRQPSARVFFDRVFGTFMFVDPFAPGVTRLVEPRCCGVLLRGLLAREAREARFPDVSKNDPNRAILGLLARAGILPETAPGKFQPQAHVTTAQLSAAVSRAHRFAMTSKLAVPAMKPGVTMTREQAAVALFRSLTTAH